MQVFEKVRSYIDANHLKQVSIAKKAGIHPSALSAMLKGKRKMYVDDLRAICCSLNVSADIFINNKEHVES